MKYAGNTVTMLVYEGEIMGVFNDECEAQCKADSINESNLEDEIEEAGYDPEEISFESRGAFAYAAGYNSGFAYCEDVTIPEEYSIDEDAEDYDEDEDIDEDDEYCTSQGDKFTYSEIISAIDSAVKYNGLELDC